MVGQGTMVYRPLRYEQMMKAAENYDVRARRMFGGMGIYTGEKMFAFLHGDEIGLKLGEDDRSVAMELAGATPLIPEEGAEPMREYVQMPHEILDNYDRFIEWVEKSAAYALRKKVH